MQIYHTPWNVVGLLDPQVNDQKIHHLPCPLDIYCGIQNSFLMSKTGINLEIGWKKKSRSPQTGMEYMLTQSKINLGVNANVNRD